MDTKNKDLHMKNIMTILLFILFVIFTFGIAEKIYILSIFSTIILMIVSIRCNVLTSMSFVILGVALTYIIGGELLAIKTALLYYIPSLLSGILISSSRIRKIYIRKIKDIKKVEFKENQYVSVDIFLITILIFSISIAAYYMLMKYVYNDDIVKNLQSILDNILGVYRENLKPEDMKRIEDAGVFAIFENIGSIFAVLIFSQAIIYSILCYFIAISISNKLYSKKIEAMRIDGFILPGKPVLVMFVSALILFLIGYSNPNYNTEYIITNYIAVMNILFLLQGMSIFVYIIKNWRKTKSAVNWLLFLTIVIFMGVVPGIAIIGMLDSMVNYRVRWLTSGE